jgi:hypothetical protein
MYDHIVDKETGYLMIKPKGKNTPFTKICPWLFRVKGSDKAKAEKEKNSVTENPKEGHSEADDLGVL